MSVSILRHIQRKINARLTDLIVKKTSKAYNDVKKEITKFLIDNQDRHDDFLAYLANIALSDSFGTLIGCLNYSLEILDNADESEYNMRRTAYKLIFLYLKAKLEWKAMFLHKLVKHSVVCKHCGKETLLIIKYKSNNVCQHCGNIL